MADLSCWWLPPGRDRSQILAAISTRQHFTQPRLRKNIENVLFISDFPILDILLQKGYFVFVVELRCGACFGWFLLDARKWSANNILSLIGNAWLRIVGGSRDHM